MTIPIQALKDFKKITGNDISQFFTNCIVFFSKDYNKIVAFYSGAQSTISKDVFDNLTQLEKDCENVFSTFHSLSSRFNNCVWWDVLEMVEQIDSRLKTLRNINKWSRSSLKGVNYSPSYQIDYITKQGQTIERVVQDVLNNNDEEEWVDIATSNHLREEDYDLTGGTEIQLNFSNVNKGIQVESVVAVMVGKAIYGLDVYKKLQFDNDEGDLVVLDYDHTVSQSVDILIQLKRNDNPSYPNDGIQREVIIGGNRATMNFPIIQRQLSSTFETDDTLKGFTVTNLAFDQDSLVLDFQVSTRLNEVTAKSALV